MFYRPFDRSMGLRIINVFLKGLKLSTSYFHTDQFFTVLWDETYMIFSGNFQSLIKPLNSTKYSEAVSWCL